MIGRPDHPKQPFRMLGSTHADARYTRFDKRLGKEVTVQRSGRASFVWQMYVLVPLACGSTDAVDVRWGRGREHGPWHTITGSDDAYRQIMDYYRLQGGLRRMVTSHRVRRGLPVDEVVTA